MGALRAVVPVAQPLSSAIAGVLRDRRARGASIHACAVALSRHRSRIGWISRWIVGAVVLAVVVRTLQGTALTSVVRRADYGLFIVAACLLIPNIVIQFLRWRLLVRVLDEHASHADVAASLFSGFAWGLITPARIGELSGRASPLRGIPPAAVVLFSSLEKLGTLGVTVAAGSVSAFLFRDTLARSFVQGGVPPGIVIVIAMVIVLAASCALLLRRGHLRRLLDRIPGRITEVLSTGLRSLTCRKTLVVLLFSSGFYIVFVSQFVILLIAFGSENSVSLLGGAMAVMFFKSLVPPVSVGELGVREGVSLAVLTAFGCSPAATVGASLTLFAINVLLPAVAGGVVLLARARRPAN